LVRACLASAPGAWDEFVGTFAGLLGYVVDRTSAQHRIPLPGGERDDVVAEILLELLRNDAAALRAFAGRASLPTYLVVIARRVAVRSLQRARDRRPIPVGDAVQPADRHDAASALADREAVEALLETLDTTEARLIRLHHLEARSYGEISRLTGLPVGSIGPALSKARQKMRDHAAGIAVP
jgi:RNA polymerase sigma-70 factor (ECF subfamily)